MQFYGCILILMDNLLIKVRRVSYIKHMCMSVRGTNYRAVTSPRATQDGRFDESVPRLVPWIKLGISAKL